MLASRSRTTKPTWKIEWTAITAARPDRPARAGAWARRPAGAHRVFRHPVQDRGHVGDTFGVADDSRPQPENRVVLVSGFDERVVHLGKHLPVDPVVFLFLSGIELHDEAQ